MTSQRNRVNLHLSVVSLAMNQQFESFIIIILLCTKPSIYEDAFARTQREVTFVFQIAIRK